MIVEMIERLAKTASDEVDLVGELGVPGGGVIPRHQVELPASIVDDHQGHRARPFINVPGSFSIAAKTRNHGKFAINPWCKSLGVPESAVSKLITPVSRNWKGLVDPPRRGQMSCHSGCMGLSARQGEIGADGFGHHKSGSRFGCHTAKAVTHQRQIRHQIVQECC